MKGSGATGIISAVVYVLSAAVLNPTPRFSEVHRRVPTKTALAVYLFTDKKPLKRLGLLSGVVNTQLKQGVNERISRRLTHTRS